jgi:hypothetical protein
MKETRQFREGDWVILSGPSVFAGVRAKILGQWNNSEEHYVVEINGKPCSGGYHCAWFMDKKDTIALFYEKIQGR